MTALFPSAGPIGIDSRVLTASLLLSLGTALLFGLAPTLRALRQGPAEALRAAGRGGSVSAERHRVQRALVLAEVAVALVLVVGAALVGKSLWRLVRQDLGLATEGALTMRISPPTGRFPDDADLQAFYADVLERAAAVPGVTDVGVVNLLPVDGGIMGTSFATRDQPRLPGQAPQTVDVRIVSPGTFRALGVPVVRGRSLEASDRGGPAGLINESFARRLWPGADPVGHEILWDNGEEWFTVVGVVADMRQRGPGEEPRAEAYRMVSQEVWSRSMYLVARTDGEPRRLAGPLAAAVHAVDATTPVSRVRTLEDVAQESLAQRRFVTALFTVFGAVALLLGAVGVYGVTSFVLARRRREFGVRLALGATPRSVLGVALREALRPVLLGLAAGALLCLAFTRLLGGLLFQVDALDPWVLAGVAVGLALVGAAAAWIPARRAAATDPRDSLLSA
ncbi:MAG: FtsX-like permease family protein [Thermoanaerobaculia bacterium]